MRPSGGRHSHVQIGRSTEWGKVGEAFNGKAKASLCQTGYRKCVDPYSIMNHEAVVEGGGAAIALYAWVSASGSIKTCQTRDNVTMPNHVTCLSQNRVATNRKGISVGTVI